MAIPYFNQDFKKGRTKCSLATSVTQRGDQKQIFQFFYYIKEQKFWPKGAMADLAKG